MSSGLDVFAAGAGVLVLPIVAAIFGRYVFLSLGIRGLLREPWAGTFHRDQVFGGIR